MKLTKETKKAFLDALSKIRVATAASNVLEQSDHVIFKGNCLMAYSAEYAAIVPFEHDLACSVNANDFMTIMKGVKEHDVEITHEGDTLKIVSKKTSAELSTEVYQRSAEELLEAIGYELLKWKPLPEGFYTALSLCVPAVSKTDHAENTNGVLIHKDRVLATDRMRVSEFILPEGTKMPKTIIRFDNVNTLLKYPFSQYAISSAWFHVKDETGAIFSVRTLAGDFLNVDMLLENEGAIFKLPVELAEVLDALAPLCVEPLDMDKVVTLTFGDDRIKAQIAKDRLKIDKEIELEGYDGRRVQLMANPVHLSQVIKLAQGEDSLVEMQVEDEKARMTKGNFTHALCVMLMK